MTTMNKNTLSPRKKPPRRASSKRLTDQSRAFFLALARVVEHYLPDERAHYRTCGQTLRQQHVYRDLRTVQRTLRRWLEEAK